jgi:hypothetical protein
MLDLAIKMFSLSHTGKIFGFDGLEPFKAIIRRSLHENAGLFELAAVWAQNRPRHQLIGAYTSTSTARGP